MIDTIKIATDTFERIQRQFPSLSMRIHNDQPVELCMDIHKQTGLKFNIDLNLQNNDELHLVVAGNFWLEWFPCTKKKKVEEYIEAVSGVLSGKYRILEHYRDKKVVKAELQSPEKDGWKTIGTWATWSFPFPWRKNYNVVQNN